MTILFAKFKKKNSLIAQKMLPKYSQNGSTKITSSNSLASLTRYISRLVQCSEDEENIINFNRKERRSNLLFTIVLLWQLKTYLVLYHWTNYWRLLDDMIASFLASQWILQKKNRSLCIVCHNCYMLYTFYYTQ